MNLRPLVAALVLASACSGTRGGLRSGQGPLARQAIDPGQADAVFTRAVRALERRGYDFLTCDLDRGAMRTARIEKDVPCGETSCLARQVVTVKLGWRSVRLAVVREVFDGGYRAWIPAADPTSVEDVSREEEVLLRELLAADLEGARPPGPGAPGGPCQQAGPCGPGQCSVMLLPTGR
jgi:hypothetical protein